MNPGAAKCWGDNANGQLGNGVTADSHVPIQVTGLTSGVQAIAAGTFHSCAIVNGAAQCWGLNINGQLGNGVPGNSHVPVQVARVLTATRQVIGIPRRE